MASPGYLLHQIADLNDPLIFAQISMPFPNGGLPILVADRQQGAALIRNERAFGDELDPRLVMKQEAKQLHQVFLADLASPDRQLRAAPERVQIAVRHGEWRRVHDSRFDTFEDVLQDSILCGRINTDDVANRHFCSAGRI